MKPNPEIEKSTQKEWKFGPGEGYMLETRERQDRKKSIKEIDGGERQHGMNNIKRSGGRGKKEAR